ncbi:hypothetical protein HH308_22085 [Gordonia sp. TBRC 11910]|uniref:Uncharacterized protein n=1 Tax=Gordonia asplenii TaxID=2725283 RepID=A0A848L0D9_9ACTN|nr:hypothetical protein [Gordonia asplenii]NMO03907.1 hypothetical protein [Gordonia asplenii]
MTGEQESTRPTQVLWALRLWVTSGTVLAALGLVTLVAGAIKVFGETIAIGVILTLIGAGYCVAARKLAIAHDLRVRSSLAVTSLVVVVLLLMASLLIHGAALFPIALVVALIGLFGSLLAYRPESEAWFAQEDGK